MEQRAIAGLAIAVIAIVLLSMLFRDVGDSFEKLDVEEIKCRESIKAHAQTTSWTAGEVGGAIACEPRRPDPISEERVLAEEMRNCWDRWQQGSLELFQEQGTYCNVCSFVSLTKDFENFGEFLATTDAPHTPLTYAEHFSPYLSEFSEDVAMPNAVQQVDLDSEQPYAVIFVYSRGTGNVGSWFTNFLWYPDDATLDLAAGAGAGAAGGGLLMGAAYLGGASVALSSLPFWVVGGAAAGAAYVIGFSGLETPQWISLIGVIPNEPEALNQWGCEFSGQRSQNMIKDV